MTTVECGSGHVFLIDVELPDGRTALFTGVHPVDWLNLQQRHHGSAYDLVERKRQTLKVIKDDGE